MIQALAFIKSKSVSLLRLLLFYLIVANILRLLFLVLFYEPAPLSEYLLSFLISLRFDLATFAILFAPLLLLIYILPKQRFLVFLAAILFSAALSVYISDLFYFPYVGRRLGIEIFVLFQDFFGTVGMALTEVWYMWIVYPFIVYFLYRMLGRVMFVSKIPAYQGLSFWPYQTLAFVILICLTIIAIRGGLQSRPLRPAMACLNDNVFLCNLSLNPVYTIVQAIDKQDKLPIFVRDRKLLAKSVHKYLLSKNEKALSNEFIFQRKIVNNRIQTKKNIVLVILESWSAQDLASFGNKINATPFFTKLVSMGHLYTNFYATGQRSISSLPSIVGSIPSIHGSVISMSSFQNNRQRSLGSIFKSLGYETFFTYAAKKTSMGFYSYAKANGFKHIITKEDFANNEELSDGTWGIFDHISFSFTAQKIKETGKPFLAVIYSLHPHPPFNLPKGHNHYRNINRANFFNAMRYSDYALEQLVTQLEQIDNTLFVFTADHAYGDKKGLKRFHIPLLIYEKGKTKGKRIKTLGSQLDIMPTILDMLNVQVMHASMGKSLLQAGERRILLDQDQLMLFGDGKQLVRFNRDSFNSVVGFNRQYSVNALESEPMQQEYRRFISAISLALQENKIIKNN